VTYLKRYQGKKMRANHINSAAKPHVCGACGVTINKGDPYSWAKGRFGPKMTRCAQAKCRFKPSDLTSNEKLSKLYAAQEVLEEALGNWQDTEGGDATDLREALEAAAEEAREAAGMYEESAEAIEEGFGHPTSQSEELRDNGADAEGWADELDQVAGDLEDGDETDEDWDEEQWRSEIIGTIEDVVGSLPL
jgi:hypothetical protein